MSKLTAKLVIGRRVSHVVFSVDGVEVARQVAINAMPTSKKDVFDVTMSCVISDGGVIELNEI